MQLMIDILAETPAALRLAAEFLNTHAALREASEVPTGTQPAPFVPPAPTMSAPPVTVPAGSTLTPSSAPAGAPLATIAPSAPPAPSNVLPFAPPVPAAPGAMVPGVSPAPGISNAPSAVIPGTSASPIAPPAPSSNAATVPPGASAAPLVDEYDSAGVPWDSRIHQKGKSVKKDKTWKLQKGIADAVVSAVMQELAPRIRRGPAAPLAPPAPPAPADTGTPAAVGASAPVTFPPLPPVTGGPQGVGSPVAPPAPPAPGPETIAPAADPYRALIKKVTDARTARRCTAEEVTQCVAAAGVPSLQALNAMPHLIQTVEAHIDALLAMR